MSAKHLLVAIALIVLVASPVLADYPAGTTNIKRITGYYGGNGGEFTLYNNSLDTSAYDVTTRDQAGKEPSFQSFCVEHLEYIETKMDMVISTTNIDESNDKVTGQGSHAILGGNTYGDNLDKRTAYLYTKFAQGTLSGYDYTVGAGREASAVALQEAIWYIEQEGGGVYNSFVTLADNAVASGGEWVGMGIGDVRVINMWAVGAIGDVSQKKQDQLYLIPAPAAMVLGLLGLGLVGWLKRRVS